MRALVLNGSPHGKGSTTMKLTAAFTEGLAQNGCEVETVNIIEHKINGCRGCMACWANGGNCVIKDNVPELQEKKYFKSDLIIWSFPLYYFGIPSQLKAFMDRLFVNCYPDMVTSADGFPNHPSRHDMGNMKHVFISTCGFYTAENLYRGVQAHFMTLYRSQFRGGIACGEGALFLDPESAALTGPYIEKIKKLGADFPQIGNIPEEASAELAKPLIPIEQYMKNANSQAGWKYRYDHSKD